MFTHSAKKSDFESSNSTKKEAKRKREPSVTSDVEKTPPNSPEEEDDDGVQVNIVSKKSLNAFFASGRYGVFLWAKPTPKDCQDNVDKMASLSYLI